MSIRNEREANNAIAETCEERYARYRQARAAPSKRVYTPIDWLWLAMLGLAVLWVGVIVWVVM